VLAPAVNGKCGWTAGADSARIQAGVAGDVGAEVQKEFLPSLGETQYINRLGTDEFPSSAATPRRSTRVPIRLKFFHRLDRIIAQRTLAGGDNIIDSRRTREAKVVFVGIGASETRVKLFFLRFFRLYTASSNGQTHP